MAGNVRLDHPRAQNVSLATARAVFAPTKVLAANQGLYNGFLAAGLLWALLITDPDWHRNVACFFLGCVAVAGVYGALTAGPRILLVQTVPALLALAALQLAS